MLGFLAVAATGFGVFLMMFSSWSSIRSVTGSDADEAFRALYERVGDRPAYLAIDDQGQVSRRSELEHEEAAELEILGLLAWRPASAELFEVRFPYWFVRVKMTDSLNLGTLTTFLSGDWEHLNLSVSEQDLARFGAGIVLDHRLPDGTRIVLWNE